MERLYAETRHGKISYLHRPGKYPVIFLHGLGGAGNNWIRLNQYLNSDYELFFIDQLGHGRSDRPKIDYHVRTQCEVLLDFINGLKISRFALVGNSYGGWVSLRFALDYMKPDFLVLEDSAGINPTVADKSVEEMETFIDRVMKMGGMNDREILRQIMVNNMDPAEKIKLGELSKLDARTLIIWGRKDRMIGIGYGHKLHDSIKGSKFIVIEEGGHIPHSTNTNEIAKALNEFIAIEAV